MCKAKRIQSRLSSPNGQNDVRHKTMAVWLRASLTLRLLIWAVQYIWHIDTECHNNILDKNEGVFGSLNIYYSFFLHMAVTDRGE